MTRYPSLDQAELRARRAAIMAEHEAVHAANRRAWIAARTERSERARLAGPSGAERLAQVRRTIADVAPSRHR